MNDITHSDTVARIDALADRAGQRADDALSATRRAANGAIDKLQDNVDHLRHDAQGALGRAAAQVDDLTRRGIERARQVSTDLRLQAERGSERTVSYIKDQPVKSVLIAAATGAALAALIGLLARSRSDLR